MLDLLLLFTGLTLGMAAGYYWATQRLRSACQAQLSQINLDYQQAKSELATTTALLVDKKAELVQKNGDVIAVNILNRLSFDVEFYAQKLLAETEKEIGHLYPADEKGQKPIAYYWARVGTCSNPTCQAEVPLLKGFYLANTKKKQIYLNPIIDGTQIGFEIKKGKYEEDKLKGWNKRGNLECPCCGSITDVKLIKKQNIDGNLGERLLAVIIDEKDGKGYRLPIEEEINVVKGIPKAERPTERMQRNSAGGDTFTWGGSEWGQMFSNRQLLTLQTLVAKLNDLKAELKPHETEYGKAVTTYLAMLIDRGTAISTSFGRWDVSRENVQSPFSKQAIPMIFDYPEANLLGKTTGSLLNQLDWIIRYIESESSISFSTELRNASSGDKSQFADKYLSAVVTDPPYFDAIAYADLSDFFYVWLKRTLADVYPLNFATPQTPKTEECTALKHHHTSKEAAKQHFEDKLGQILDAIEHQTSDLVSIMFAHQSTEAWTTLCNSILGARMNITGSWAMDTEMANRSLGLAGSALASSVTVACKPTQRQSYGSYKEVKKAIEKTVALEVDMLYKLGFRGADLLTACFGQAVSEFGQYEKVEKADGSEVTVAELLEMAKESAFNALLKGFDGDDFTKFYIGWLQLYGFAESEFDDAAKLSRVGLSVNVADLFTANILVKNGKKQTLGSFAQRLQFNKKLGEKPQDFLIDHVHRAMALYKGTNRRALLLYIDKVADSPESPFWRVVTSLCEVLPGSSEDHQQALGLLANKDSLLRESKTIQPIIAEQTNLFE
jgi:putative DNA methylase